MFFSFKYDSEVIFLKVSGSITRFREGKILIQISFYQINRLFH